MVSVPRSSSKEPAAMEACRSSALFFAMELFEEFAMEI